MKIGLSVTVKRKGDAGKWFAGFQKRMKGPHAVKVGFPAGTTGRHPNGLVDIVQIAIWNHYGTAGSGTNFVRNGVGGFGGPIPPRPFITVAIFKHRRQIRKLLKDIYVDILHGKTTAEIGLSRLGQYGVSIIQDSIKSGNWAPNSPLTIKIKGSSRPLIDGGHMVGAVTFALEGGGRSASYRGGQAAGKAFGRALAKMFGGR